MKYKSKAGLEKYHAERDLITEIVTSLTGRSNDLEEWYTYHIKKRDETIESLREQIRCLELTLAEYESDKMPPAA